MKYSTRLMLCSIFSLQCLAQPYRIGTVAGGRPIGDGGPATDASLLFPCQIAADNSGNLYIADKDNNRVRRVTPGGVIGTVAGSGFAGYAGDGTQAVSARLYRPSGVAVDSAGNLYIADTLNHRIRRVSPSGVITTFAGTGVAGYGGDGGPAGSALLNAPVALAADGAGNLYIADRDNHRVRRVDSAGTISSVAGNGRPDYGGDGGPATAAALHTPSAIAVDSSGAVYIADTDNHRIRRIASGTITTFAGNGTSGPAGDGGSATAAQLNAPQGLAFDATGNLYIGDSLNNRVRQVTRAGAINTVPGTETLIYPTGIAVTSGGDLLIAETDTHLIRRLRGASLAIFAGTQQTGDGGPAIEALLRLPRHVAVDGQGALYIADDANHRVRRVGSDGGITTVAGTGAGGFAGDGGPAGAAELRFPRGVAIDNQGNLYIADVDNQRIRRVGPDGVISTIAGTGKAGYGGDGGPAVSASLNNPYAVAVDSAGNVYIADRDNHRIRRVATNGNIATVAGNGRPEYSGENVPAVAAALRIPSSIALDSAGNLFIADTGNHRIRRVSPAGVITTVAGAGTPGFGGDGGPATAAQFTSPHGVAVDSSGTLYIADTGNQRVRRVLAGVVGTIAGTNVNGFAGDGGAATMAQLNSPFGVAADTQGAVFFSDSENQRIRRLAPTLSATPASLIFSFTIDDPPLPPPAAQTLNVSSSLPFPFSITTTSDGWLSVNPGAGATPASLRVTANPKGLAPGDYTGLIEVLVPGLVNSPLRVLVTLRVQVAPRLVLFPPGPESFNYQVGEPVPPPRTVFVASTGPDLNFTAVATSSGNWLSVVPAGGRTLAPVSVSVNPASLAAGAYAGFVTVTAPGAANSPQQLNVTLQVVTRPTLIPFPDGLTFDYRLGSPRPPSQALFALSNAGRVDFEASASVSSPQGGAWLQLGSPSAGATPGQLTVSVSPAGLSAGEYKGFVAILAPNAANPKSSVPVTLNVLEPPGASLVLEPPALSFGTTPISPPMTHLLTLRNPGTEAAAFRASASGGDWLSVSPDSGTVGPGGAVILYVAAKPAGLSPGTYTGRVSVSLPAGDSVGVPVTMAVSRAEQLLLLSQSGFTFTSVVGGGTEPPQSFAVLNAGQEGMAWSASASTRSGGNWLSVGPLTGYTDPASTVVPEVQVSVNAAGLAAGMYYGQVQVSARGADNSPQSLTILLQVLERGTTPAPVVRPAGVVFVARVGQPPPAQEVAITNLWASPMPLRSSHLTGDGTEWLQETQRNPVIAPGETARLAVQANFTGLGPGVRRGVLTLLYGDGGVRTVNALSVLTAGDGAAAGAASRRAADGACRPTRLLPLITSLFPQFTTPAAVATPIHVRVVDDCGVPFTGEAGGAVRAEFSNGDESAVLQSLKDGMWSGYWKPRRIAASVVVTITAENRGAGLTGSVQLPGGVGAAAPGSPVVSQGIGSLASTSALLPVAPGSLIAIRGHSLADSTVSAEPPFSTLLAGAKVWLGDQFVPLLSADPAQLTAQVPFGVRTGTRPQLIVMRGATQTFPESLTVAEAQPFVFSKDGSGSGQGLIYRVPDDGAPVLADSANPARAGDVIRIDCTGLGALTETVNGGAAAPADIPVAAPVTVTIGGVTAEVAWAGLPSGAVGRYRVQAIVPPGVPPGSAVEVVVSAGGLSSPPVTMAVR